MKYKIVTSDYDDTLLFHQYDPELGTIIDFAVNTDLVHRLRAMIDRGVTVYIVTARDPAWEDDTPLQTPPYRFVKEQNLDVAGIYYTSGEFKAETLKRLGSELHFDDNEEEMMVISGLAPRIQRVMVKQPQRRRLRFE